MTNFEAITLQGELKTLLHSALDCGDGFDLNRACECYGMFVASALLMHNARREQWTLRSASLGFEAAIHSLAELVSITGYLAKQCGMSDAIKSLLNQPLPAEFEGE